jgi:hypothetical protein
LADFRTSILFGNILLGYNHLRAGNNLRSGSKVCLECPDSDPFDPLRNRCIFAGSVVYGLARDNRRDSGAFIEDVGQNYLMTSQKCSLDFPLSLFLFVLAKFFSELLVSHTFKYALRVTWRAVRVLIFLRERNDR